MEDLVGKTVGQYQIKAEVGRGGMATVYRGYQASLNRAVAVKVLAVELARDPDFRQRFQREAHAVAQLAHPHILAVYDFGEDPATGVVYLVTQFVEGGTLAGRMGGPMPPTEAARIAAQIARALAFAHAAGVIHRDVKPGNVLMTSDGHPLLSDFGIAKIMAETRMTRTGTSLGTPAYMSPEQAQGMPADHRSDIYALGVMLYEMLAGVLPFQADTPVALLHQHVATLPPPLREHVPGIPKSLEKIVMRALAKNPDDRFATAGEFADALDAAREATGQRKRFGIRLGRKETLTPIPTPVPGGATNVAGPVPGTPPPVAVIRPRTPSRLTRILKTQQVGRVASGAGRWFLRTGLSVLAVLLIVGIVLLVGAAFALGAVAEQSLTKQPWVFDNLEPGYKERVACADLATNTSETLQPYTLDALTDVEVVCRPPDTVELSGKFRGAPVSTQVRIRTVKGVPAVRWERLNNVPLYIVGGIVSDGVNRGLVKAWANAPVVLDMFLITEAAIEVTYAANPTVPARTP